MSQSSGDRHYKFTYFPVRGRGEICRLVLAAAGVQYDDNRVDIDAWRAIKPGTPFHHIPILEFTEPQSGQKVTLSESNTIVRYLAREHGLCGKDSLEESRADMIYEVMNDFRQQIVVKIKGESDPDKKKQLMDQFREEWFPRYAKNLVRQLKEGNGGGEDGPYFTGNQMTYADLSVYNMMSVYVEVMCICVQMTYADLSVYNMMSVYVEVMWPGLLSQYPALEAHMKRVGQVERVKAWVETRPQTDK